MTKTEIQDRLTENHEAFIEYLDSLTEEAFLFSYADKWTAGQQLKHIYLSVKPLAQGLILPAFLLKPIFGRANRPSKSYDQLVEQYYTKLAAGGRASSPYVPEPVHFDQKEQLFKSLTRLVGKLNHRLGKYSEAQLDQLILPHPLLGKVTLREMLFFTICHVGHHQKSIEDALKRG